MNKIKTRYIYIYKEIKKENKIGQKNIVENMKIKFDKENKI